MRYMLTQTVRYGPYIGLVFAILVLLWNLWPHRPSVPAPWPTQLAAVAAAAHRAAPDAVLTWASAQPVQRPVDPSSPFCLTFWYLQPTGSVIEVTWDDTTGQATVDTNATNEQLLPATPDRGQPSAAELQALHVGASAVHIGPAAALRLTLAEGRVFSAQHQHQVVPSIALLVGDMRPSALHDIPALWNVSYLVPGSVLNLYVDARTGTVLDYSK